MNQPKLRKGTKVYIKSLHNTEERCGLMIDAQKLVGKILTIDSYTRAGKYHMKETKCVVHEDDFEIVQKESK